MVNKSNQLVADEVKNVVTKSKVISSIRWVYFPASVYCEPDFSIRRIDRYIMKRGYISLCNLVESTKKYYPETESIISIFTIPELVPNGSPIYYKFPLSIPTTLEYNCPAFHKHYLFCKKYAINFKDIYGFNGYEMVDRTDLFRGLYRNSLSDM